MGKLNNRVKMKTVGSLVCLIKSVENKYTTIDLQNETTVHGFVKEVDCDMNVTLNDVTLTDPNGKRYSCENLFLKSRLIRYVHLSNEVNIFDEMKAVITKTFPRKIKTSNYSMKSNKVRANQEKLKREVQYMNKNDNA